MALSANSLIHYTSELYKILSIIRQKGVRFSYCLESVNTRGSKNFSAAIAMVSFCDIPLSDYKKHFYNKKNTGDLGYYGDYGIGLSKKWARRSGLNPVFYVDSKSVVGTSLRKDFEQFMKQEARSDEQMSDQIFLYAKNYEGELHRGGELKKKDYRYYDEREWRLVPDLRQLNNHPAVLDRELYLADKSGFQKAIEKNLLNFNLEDISYIIVKNDIEKPEIYKALKDAFKSDEDVLDLTRITVLTSEQIVGDF